MKIVLLGSKGQLGETLTRSELVKSGNLIALDSKQLNICDALKVRAALDELQPEIIINAAAYTAVDAAENDSAAAFAVNAQGAENLARWVQKNERYMLHLSTDFVFNGARNTPYGTEDDTDPLSVYGKSKLAGERIIHELLPQNSSIIRTSWLYSPYGKNFVKTMLRLMREREKISVVVDQIGTPCSTQTLSDCITSAVQICPVGLFHWSDAGIASWYDFAIAIQEEALQLGMLDDAIPVTPILSKDYPVAARRPVYSVLDKSRAITELRCQPVHWRSPLRDCLKKMQSGAAD